MKTELNHSKDNFTGLVLAGLLITIAAAAFTGTQAHASPAARASAQKMDTIVVTGSRHADAVLDTVVVTAPRLKKSHV